jgi:serpin B
MQYDHITAMYGARPYEVDLKLPRFETDSDTDKLEKGLIGLLEQMGIHLAFNRDLSEIPNMCEDSNVYISMMRQKAKIKVNEEGSEAAAVTVIGMIKTSIPSEPQHVNFHATRPFLYVISEQSTGAIFFIGQYMGD